MKNRNTLIVTGSASGIGKAIVNDSHVGKGCRIFGIDVHSQSPVDVRDYGAIASIMEQAIVPKAINYLVSCAGAVFFTNPKTGKPVDFAAAPIEQLRAMAEINFMGTVNVLHAFISRINKTGAFGNIVVISSISAFHSGGVNMAVYDSTKAAISSLAKRLVPYRNIRINVIDPGSIRTNIGAWNLDFSHNPSGKKIVKDGQDADQKRLGKEVSVAQVVELVKFLLFANHGLNGAEIVQDEGLTLVGRDGY